MKDMLIVDPDHRATSEVVRDRLEEIHRRCTVTFATRPNPWSKHSAAPVDPPPFHQEDPSYPRTDLRPPEAAPIQATPWKPELPARSREPSISSLGSKESFHQAQPLGERIFSAFAVSDFDTREQDYLPEGELHRLITRRVVVDELKMQAPDDEDLEFLIDWIVIEARRIFAITLECSVRGPRK